MKTIMETNNNQRPIQATHPGTILLYELKERGITQKAFAATVGMRSSHLNDLIKGRRPMTKTVADRIEQALGISSVSLVNLQNQYDYDMRHSHAHTAAPAQSSHILALCGDMFGVSTVPAVH